MLLKQLVTARARKASTEHHAAYELVESRHLTVWPMHRCLDLSVYVQDRQQDSFL